MKLSFSDIQRESLLKNVDEKNSDSFPLSQFFRIANKNDEKALCVFHEAVFSKNESSLEAYLNLALKFGRTYVLDISEREPFILSALTIIPTSKGEKYLVFGGTVPPLRKRGLFSELLSFVEETEKRYLGGFNAIYIPNSPASLSFMKKRGFSYEALGLECVLKGKNKNKHDFRKGIYAGADYKLCKDVALEETGIYVKAFSELYKYFSSKGGIFGQFGDGYIAFVPTDLIKTKAFFKPDNSESLKGFESSKNDSSDSLRDFKSSKTDNSESLKGFESSKTDSSDNLRGFEDLKDENSQKGKFIIYECAVSVKELKKLPSAFQSCVLPIWKKDELQKEKIQFETVLTAVSNFPLNNRFIFGVQSFF